MKKIYVSFLILLFCVSVLSAQSSRTVQTIVADVLAQMPATNQTDYNKQIGDLASTGEDGILTLVKMINPSGQGSNAAVDYALSALSYYVMENGRDDARLVTANAYVKALDLVDEREAKAFIIRQLQAAGKDESVDALARFLNQEELSGPAARALATIGTERAAQALQASLLRRMGTPKTQRDVILAIGEAQLSVPEDLIKGMLDTGNESFRKDVLYTLSRIGSKASQKELAVAAEKAGFALEKTGANEAYITLLKRMVQLGETKEAEKAANDLLKKATKANQTHTRNAALQILLSIRKEDGLKLVLNALKDPFKEYRNAALDYTSCFAGKEVYVELFKTMMKAKPEKKADILNWIGRESTCPEKNPIIKNLEIRFDLTAKQVLLDLLKSGDPGVKQAAVWALVKIGDTSVIPALAGLLTDNDKQTVQLAKEALASFKGDIAPAVTKIIPQAPDAGKMAAVELLAMRKASANINTVLEWIKSGSPEVKTAAYTALKDVVAEKDFTLLCGMLESADASAVVPLQQAVIASLASQSKANQVATISRRMLQAGESKKHLYYAALAATGDRGALATIVNGFKQGSGAAKEAAFDALLDWKGLEAAGVLYAICRDASAASYCDRAFTGYVKLISNPSLTGENRMLGLGNALEVAKTDQQKNSILRQLGRTGTFQGMLLAGEFLDNKALQQNAANAVMNIALSHPDYTGTTVRALLQKASGVLDNPDAGYQREAIKKHLDEMPAGEGFVSLFNGKDLTGWKGLVENPVARAKMKPAQLEKAQVKADEQMRNDWKVKDGLLVFDGAGYDNICTVKQYGDFEMYVDWKLDPNGHEPDAGIYLRGTPQVQMWDTSRVKVGAQVGSGGLYNNRLHESKPLKVADNPLGEWNTMYIKIVGDRVTVYLNGELVTDNVILENFWDRKQPIFPIEQIELQAHGSKVYYRTIYVKELERPEAFTLSAEEVKEGYKMLFDGTNMFEWTGNTVDYTSREDGTITLLPGKGSGGNLYTKNEYGNFVFRFEFMLTPAANNGLGIRTPMEGDAAYVGMELQILDSEHPVYKDLQIYQYHGSVYGILPAKRGFLKPTGEWNCQEVIADGDHIKITLNGEVILDGNIREATRNGTPDKREHPGLFNKKGHIGFLGHGSEVKFRNIRIKENP
jgi:HEAT repeat protein